MTFTMASSPARLALSGPLRKSRSCWTPRGAAIRTSTSVKDLCWLTPSRQPVAALSTTVAPVSKIIKELPSPDTNVDDDGRLWEILLAGLCAFGASAGLVLAFPSASTSTKTNNDGHVATLHHRQPNVSFQRVTKGSGGDPGGGGGQVPFQSLMLADAVHHHHVATITKEPTPKPEIQPGGKRKIYDVSYFGPFR